MNLQTFLQNLIPWFLSHGVKIICVLTAAYLIERFSKTFIEKTLKNRLNGKLSKNKEKMVETLISIFDGTLRFVVWIGAIAIILPEFGINIAPILAGLGLIGFAVGMASKEILSDFISGIFILLEKQYFVGDKVKIAGIEGKIKEMSLRKTIIEDEAGTLHLIPNSQIKIVAKK